MLQLEAQSSLEELEEGLRMAQRWWNAQQANPKYRGKASGALARLREARELLLDPIRRQENLPLRSVRTARAVTSAPT